jgi:predicted SAM-dependent methyltransferase
MRPEEAAYLGAWLSMQHPTELSPLIELGASTEAFLETHPHVQRRLLGPLIERGVRIVKTDIQPGPHIDIAGDIYDPAVQEELKAVEAKCILCCNILEHVTDREEFARVCDEILSPGGTIVVSVPQSYPLHMDPIDTYYRPKPDEIAQLFPGYEVLVTATVVSGTAAADMANPWLEVPKVIRRALILQGGVGATKARLHRLLWLFRRYRISAAVLRKPDECRPRCPPAHS